VIVRVLGSGSKGNAVLLESEQTRVLIDVGFSSRGMQKRLEAFEIPPKSIEAVVVTHEHTDHVGGAAACVKRWEWRVLASAGTRADSRSLADVSVETVSTSGKFKIGDLEIRTIGVSHDANEPMAILATSRATGLSAGIVYDLGVFTERLWRAVKDVDILMIEANYDVDMLLHGPYPPVLQRRIASRYGHLSNADSAIAARECAHKRLSHIVLAHLSEKNNTPRMALETVRAALRKTDFQGDVVAASQRKVTGPFVPKVAKYRGPGQLELGL
jgi:phosphoribosyl 1,2-cyclic phosphodiesterase